MVSNCIKSWCETLAIRTVHQNCVHQCCVHQHYVHYVYINAIVCAMHTNWLIVCVIQWAPLLKVTDWLYLVRGCPSYEHDRKLIRNKNRKLINKSSNQAMCSLFLFCWLARIDARILLKRFLKYDLILIWSYYCSTLARSSLHLITDSSIFFWSKLF